METDLELCAKIENGHFPMQTRLQISDAMRRMEGKRLGIKLYVPKNASSSPQKRYYFGVIVEAIRHMFYEAGTVTTKDEMHEWLKRHVGKLLKQIKTPDGEITYVTESYRKLTTEQAEQYHAQCRQWAAERGLDIREPNEDD
jgi:hypothetical protein